MFFWGYQYLCVCVLSRFSRVRLFAIPWTVACQAPLSMGILQARVLEWVAMPSSRGSSWLRVRTHVSYVSCIGMQRFYHQYYVGSTSKYTVGISEMTVFLRKLQNNPELRSDSIGFPCLAPAQATTPLLLSKQYYISWDLQESSGEGGKRASRICLHWTPFNRSAERTAPARKPNTQPCLNLDSKAV